MAVDDGIARDALSSFLQKCLERYFDEVDAKVPSISIEEKDCFIFGRIVTHTHICFGMFPIQIAKPSFMHVLTGDVSEQVLVNSFILFLDHKQVDLIKKVTNGERSYCSNAVSDILADYRITAVVNKENAFGIVVKTAQNAFLRFPCFAFQKICKGMGKFWKGVTHRDINKIYEAALPTPETLLEVCEIDESDSQETKCVTWFCRYIRCCTPRMLQLLLRFSTGSAQLLPNKKIKATWDTNVGQMMRPVARTCFQVLSLPKNHSSFQDFKRNTDLYIKSDSWELFEV